jgi:tellurite resistance protein
MVIGVIAGMAGNKGKDSADGGNAPKPLTSTTAFQAYVSKEMKDFGEISLEVFTIEMQGPIVAPMDNCPVMKTITLFDFTKGRDDQQPVLCSLDNLQYQDTTAFFSSTLDTLPYRMSLLSNWQPMLSVPIEALTFPARGKRDLLFTVVISTINGNILAQSKWTLEYLNPRPGYLDGMKTRLKAAELAVKLAVSVSAADGCFAGTEGRVVKEWIQKRIASSIDSQKHEVKQRLNSAVESAMLASGSAAPEDIVHVCKDLIDLSPLPADSMGDKYDILELCLKVASADGTAADVELELVNVLADKLDVDRERFRTMTDKILPVSIHETRDVKTILGIDPSWDVEQKRKHLRKENRKWRALATHSDPEKQKQAREMQELIAKEMAKLEGSNEES